MKLKILLFVETEVAPEALPSIDQHYEWVQVPYSHFSTNQGEAYKQLSRLIRKHHPITLYTTGNLPWIAMNNLPYDFRKRWIHAGTLSEVRWEAASYCYIHSNLAPCYDAENPLFSVITTTWRSGHKLLRPWESLNNQTYNNWEWVLWDDTEAGNDETWNQLLKFRDEDIRVRCYRDQENSGFIGEMKWRSASMSRGDWIVEVDHDDLLHPRLFEYCREAIKKYPDTDFIFSDCIELYEDSEAPHSYGDFYGFGYCAYQKEWIRGKWHNVSITADMNAKTVRHIVGVPNHVRIWRRSFYERIGKHKINFPVVDDYELLLRSFFEGKWCRLAMCGYYQYRNNGGNNFTFLRNSLIQHLVAKTREFYEPQIQKRLDDLKIPDTERAFWTPNHKAWEREEGYTNKRFFYTYAPGIDPDKTLSVVIVADASDSEAAIEKSIRAAVDQTEERDYMLYVVGEACPALVPLMNRMCGALPADVVINRLKWWNLDDSKPVGRVYADSMMVHTKRVKYIKPGDGFESAAAEPVASEAAEPVASGSTEPLTNQLVPVNLS